MSLPMVHLIAAHRFAADKPDLIDCPEYYLGAISPDAIHIRDGLDKRHKNEIHLNCWRCPDCAAVEAYWQEHKTPFDIGYGVHVLLDGQWTLHFKECLPQIILPNGKPDPEIYYRDNKLTDFELYASDPQTPYFMEMLRRAAAPDNHPLLTQDELAGWREYTLAFFEKGCEFEGSPKYMNRAYVMDFLPGSMGMIEELYRKNMIAAAKVNFALGRHKI